MNSLGVVFGGLGTSPLYVYPTIYGTNFTNFTEDDILGIQSLLNYGIIVIVCIKYFIFVLSADNKGEGGIFALLALIPPEHGSKATASQWSKGIKAVCEVGAFIGSGTKQTHC